MLVGKTNDQRAIPCAFLADRSVITAQNDAINFDITEGTYTARAGTIVVVLNVIDTRRAYTHVISLDCARHLRITKAACEHGTF
jgi:hypothetical protein